MRIRKPEYYDRFQCIGGACSDSCCIGWEIDIDEEKAKLYRQAQGDLGERMKRCIDWNEGHFILQGKEERCPFLNKENLCDLILELGEDSLCDICREHPRYYDWHDGLAEVGVGLCCEAAGRLILEKEEPAGFVVEEAAESEKTVESEEGASFEADSELLETLFSARETAFAILQNREISIWDRLWRFIDYAEELQEMLDFGILEEVRETVEYYREHPAGESEDELAEEPEDEAVGESEESDVCTETSRQKAEVYSGILELCRRLEPINESWPEMLNSLEALAGRPEFLAKTETRLDGAVKARDYEYEHLAVYFVYRYFMKCRFDGDIRSKAALVLFCLQLIRLLDIETFRKQGSLTMEDRVQNAKFCSKEIEYSEENLELLAEAC